MAGKSSSGKKGTGPIAHRTRARSGDQPLLELQNSRRMSPRPSNRHAQRDQNRSDEQLQLQGNTDRRSQISSIDSSLLEQENEQEGTLNHSQENANQAENPTQPLLNQNQPFRNRPVMIPPLSHNRWNNQETSVYEASSKRQPYNLRSIQPKQLKKTTDTIGLKGFIQKFRSLWRRVPDSEINDYIDAKLWQRKVGSHPKIFKEGNNEEILRYFENEIAREERNRRNEPWSYARNKIVFRPKEDKSLYGNIMDFLADTREVMAYANSKRMKREMIRMAVTQLPSSLRYLKKKVEYKIITSIDAIEEEVTKHDDSLSRPVSRKYKKKLRKRAREARKRYRKRSHDSSDDDSEDEDGTSESASDSDSDSSSSSSDSDSGSDKKSRKKKKSKKDSKSDQKAKGTKTDDQHKKGTRNRKDDKDSSDLAKAINKLTKKVQALEIRTQSSEDDSIQKGLEVNAIEQKGQDEAHSKQTEIQIAVNEVTVFALEESEAQRIGVCYGCHQVGHNRNNCPDPSNRTGRPKRIFGLCFNCGQTGHYWRNCTFKLKPHLERYLKERRDKYNRKLSQLNGFQGKDIQAKGSENVSQPIYHKPKGPDNGSLPLYGDAEKYKRAVMKDQPNNVQANTISINATSAQQPFQVTSRSTVRSATIEAKRGGEWIKVTGKIDSGATTTVGSIERHGDLCLHIWKPIGTTIGITVANGESVKVVAKGLIQLRVDEKELPPAEILLVEARNWQNLLVGEDLLQDQNLSVQGKSRRA